MELSRHPGSDFYLIPIPKFLKIAGKAKETSAWPDEC